MYARKDIPTVLPDAVLRCRKLQAAANVDLDEMEKTKYRRINSIEWQQQTFQKTINERHKRWRMYDRAFRLKLKRELGADLAAALRLRTQQEEEQKMLFEKKLIEQACSSSQKKDESDSDDDPKSDTGPAAIIEQVAKSNSAHPKSYQEKVLVKTGSKSAINPRRGETAKTKLSHSTSINPETPKSSTRRPRTNRFDADADHDANADSKQESNFGSVLFRILSNIAATPDLDDDFTIKKRALEARERRLILKKDDRYFNLVKELAPRKIPGQKEIDEDLFEDN